MSDFYKKITGNLKIQIESGIWALLEVHFYCSLRNNTKTQLTNPLIIFISGNEDSETFYERFIQKIILLGYTVLFLRNPPDIKSENIPIENIDIYQYRGIKKLILSMSQSYRGETREYALMSNFFELFDAQKIGLMGHSSGGTICEYLLADLDFDEQKAIKCLFTVAPQEFSATASITKPYFLIYGNLDNQVASPFYGWDLAEKEKFGIYLKGGTHLGFFENYQEKYNWELEHLDHRILDPKKHENVLLNSFKAFFHSYLKNPDKNMKLGEFGFPIDFYDAQEVLYDSGPENKLVLKEERLSSEILKNSMEGIVATGSLLAPEVRSIETEFLELDSFNRSQYLDHGLVIAEGDDCFILADELRKLHIVLLEKTANEILKNDVEKKAKEFVSSLSDFWEYSTPPIVLLTQEIVRKRVETLEPKPLITFFSGPNSIYALTKLIETYKKEVEFFPWRHKIYGTPLVWRRKNAKVSIHLKNDKHQYLDVSDFSCLSLRLAMNVESRIDSNQINKLYKDQIVLVDFWGISYEKEASKRVKTNKKFEVVLSHPWVRQARIQSLENVLNSVTDDWTDGQFLNVMTHKLIPLPYNEIDLSHLTRIDLIFPTPSGSIMLGEIAFTN